MAIYIPGKHYLVSYDEENEMCMVSPFNVETIQQFLAESTIFGSEYLPPTRTRVEGELYGTMRFIKAKDLNNISYEELMNIIKE